MFALISVLAALGIVVVLRQLQGREILPVSSIQAPGLRDSVSASSRKLLAVDAGSRFLIHNSLMCCGSRVLREPVEACPGGQPNACGTCLGDNGERKDHKEHMAGDGDRLAAGNNRALHEGVCTV